ncbi:hypothetical protein ONA70_32455 [Micromonospora yasonensis]|nr:hypothetical protein [Micromonospora yasonensis]MCW3844802.1 hypothetical protein [Micromonospora yasonensis]
MATVFRNEATFSGNVAAATSNRPSTRWGRVDALGRSRERHDHEHED